MRGVVLFVLGILPLFVSAQSKIAFGLSTGGNIGFLTSHGDYTIDEMSRPFPALHLSISATFDFKDFLMETGLGIEGSIYKYDYRWVDITGQPLRYMPSEYDVAAYVAVPLIVYPKKLPLGIHGGIKPKLEIGSFSRVDGDVFRNKKNRFHDIRYLAPFGLDFVLGVSLPISFMRFSLRYERGLLNRLKNSPKFKEYDNQFKLVVNFRLFQKG